MANLYTDGGVGTVPGAPGRGPLRGGRPSGPRMRIAALIVAGVVAAGGAFAITEAVSGTGTSTQAGTAQIAATGPTGQAAVLNSALSDALSASPTTGTSAQPAAAARRVALRRLRRALVRLRLLGGMYGEYTFQTKKGPRTLAFERGAIVSIAGAGAGADVTVRATDGTTWTWVLTRTSVVRQDGTRAAATALADGQQVFAAGRVSGTTRDARLIVIRAASAKAS